MSIEEMGESAVERVLNRLAFSLREYVRQHDRFVIIALLFSCIPLPPACFVGVLLGLINACLLKTRHLDLREKKTIRVGLLLGMANSLLAVLLIAWIYQHITGLEKLAMPTPDLILDWLQSVFRSWPLRSGRTAYEAI